LREALDQRKNSENPHGEKAPGANGPECGVVLLYFPCGASPHKKGGYGNEYCQDKDHDELLFYFTLCFYPNFPVGFFRVKRLIDNIHSGLNKT
jgi:hypothetical protein